MKVIYRSLVILSFPICVIGMMVMFAEIIIRLILSLIFTPIYYVITGKYKTLCGEADLFDDEFCEDYFSKWLFYPFGYFLEKSNSK